MPRQPAAVPRPVTGVPLAAWGSHADLISVLAFPSCCLTPVLSRVPVCSACLYTSNMHERKLSLSPPALKRRPRPTGSLWHLALTLHLCGAGSGPVRGGALQAAARGRHVRAAERCAVDRHAEAARLPHAR